MESCGKCHLKFGGEVIAQFPQSDEIWPGSFRLRREWRDSHQAFDRQPRQFEERFHLRPEKVRRETDLAPLARHVHLQQDARMQSFLVRNPVHIAAPARANRRCGKARRAAARGGSCFSGAARQNASARLKAAAEFSPALPARGSRRIVADLHRKQPEPFPPRGSSKWRPARCRRSTARSFSQPQQSPLGRARDSPQSAPYRIVGQALRLPTG